jgi:hypothetical protein
MTAIQSIGPPPERYANWITAEWLRELAVTNARVHGPSLGSAGSMPRQLAGLRQRINSDAIGGIADMPRSPVAHPGDAIGPNRRFAATQRELSLAPLPLRKWRSNAAMNSSSG